jgi:REP element-mobilizing transposase RayT
VPQCDSIVKYFLRHCIGSFLNDDRHLFLDTPGQVSSRFDIDIFAYVLMNNHYHLLIRTPKANLSRIMQWLGTAYTHRFNIEHFQSGHLFQGRNKRYKSILVENDAYLMQLSYYIHNNPLHAGIVKRHILFLAMGADKESIAKAII